MGNLDDYNDRMRKQTLGMPVGPPTNLAQMSADMAADAQRRSMAAGRSGSASHSGGVNYSAKELLILLVIASAVCGTGMLGRQFLPGDFTFIGWLGILAGGVFAIACAGILLKRALKWALEQILVGTIIAIAATWRFITRPFRRR